MFLLLTFNKDTSVELTPMNYVPVVLEFFYVIPTDFPSYRDINFSIDLDPRSK